MRAIMQSSQIVDHYHNFLKISKGLSISFNRLAFFERLSVGNDNEFHYTLLKMQRNFD